MLNKKFISVPVKYSKTKFQEDDTKIPVEILVMHEKINRNNSNFDIEVIENAKESIKNIPILGYIKKLDGTDTKDFSGHEIELSISEGQCKFIYLERPIGVIPESNNYEYVVVDGKKYVKVIGYLWKEYLNDGYEILQENPNKSVSMEITVDDYVANRNGVIDIKAYRYLGVTVLGDTVMPGMEGANMQVLSMFNGKFTDDFYNKVEQLNKELSQKLAFNTENQTNDEGGELMEDNIDLVVEEVPVVEVAEEAVVESSNEVNIEAVESDYEKLNSEFALLKEQFEVLKSKNESLKSDVETKDSLIFELQEYKLKIEEEAKRVEMELKKTEIEAVVSEFESKLKDVEEFKLLKEKAFEFEAQALRKEFFALVGMIGMVEHAKNNVVKKNFSAIVPPLADKVEDDRYGEASKYLKK